MKNPNFVSQSIDALRQTLELARDYYAEGHAYIIQRNFGEARRLLTIAVTCVQRGVEIQENLEKHEKNHQCVHIAILLKFIRDAAESDLDILGIYERMHPLGPLPVVTSVMN